MTDAYDVNVREVEADYKTVLDRDANRETSGQEVALREVTIRIQLRKGRGDDAVRKTYAVTYRIDHDDEAVRPRTIADAHSKCQSFDIERLLVALDAAHDQIKTYLSAIDIAYTLVPSRSLGLDTAATLPNTHLELEVDNT